MNNFPHLFQPIQIKGLLISNRIVMAAMNTDYAGPDGEVTSQLIDYFVERAKGGVGLIITSAVAVDLNAKKRVGELCGYSDNFIPGLRRLVDKVHNAGSKIFMQIVHVGRELVSSTSLKFAGKAVGPSSLPHPLTGEPCRELTIEAIEEIREKFISAAGRGKEAGFDGVEIHGAHGYLLSQFISPYSNRRLDAYGGGFEGRIKFPLEVVKGIRKTVGEDFIISYRMNGNVFTERDTPSEYDESVLFAKRISPFVDLIHVSAGSGQTPRATRIMIPLMSSPRGCYAHLARAVKKEVTLPVITVGRINTPEIAEAILARGDADMVAIGRGMIADPYWGNKAKEGEVDEIRRCIACNQGCMEYLIHEEKITCIHNPAVGKEHELAITPAKKKKKILIIGGGVGGMEAARVAALRGHKVELWEKTNSLGGNANLASKTPWKVEFKGVVDYLVNQMKKLDISSKLMTEGTVAKIKENQPDELILATGAKPRAIDISGMKRDRFFLAEDILSGRLAELVSPVCVIGGGMVGLETAALLKINGHEVVVIEMLPEVGIDMRAINRAFWFDKIAELEISIRTECQVIDIVDSKLRVKLKGEENLKVLDSFPSYIVAVGYQSNNLLKEELEKEKEKLPFKFYAIGDCVSPRKALDAISEGYLVAHSL